MEGALEGTKARPGPVGSSLPRVLGSLASLRLGLPPSHSLTFILCLAAYFDSRGAGGRLQIILRLGGPSAQAEPSSSGLGATWALTLACCPWAVTSAVAVHGSRAGCQSVPGRPGAGLQKLVPWPSPWPAEHSLVWTTLPRSSRLPVLVLHHRVVGASWCHDIKCRNPGVWGTLWVTAAPQNQGRGPAGSGAVLVSGSCLDCPRWLLARLVLALPHSAIAAQL